MFTNKAFTLIELLVVVLIIGILAAIAVPKYQAAVVKSRAASMIPLGKAISNAQEGYYLANGKYAVSLYDLDVDLPQNCTISGSYNNYLLCGDIWFFDNGLNPSKEAEGVLKGTYCPGYNTDYSSCSPKRDFIVMFVNKNTLITNLTPGVLYCSVENDSELGKRVCSSLGMQPRGI